MNVKYLGVIASFLCLTNCASIFSIFRSDLENRLQNCRCLGVGTAESIDLEQNPRAAKMYAESRAKIDYLNKCHVSESDPAVYGERLVFYDEEKGTAYVCNSYYLEDKIARESSN